jgi:hypothetical protein
MEKDECKPTQPSDNTTIVTYDPNTTIPTTEENDTNKTNDSNTPPDSNTGNNPNPNQDNDKKQPPRRTATPKHQHTYRILIKAYATDKQQEKFNRLQVLNTVLRAFQKADPATSLVVPCDENYQNADIYKYQSRVKK